MTKAAALMVSVSVMRDTLEKTAQKVRNSALVQKYTQKKDLAVYKP